MDLDIATLLAIDGIATGAIYVLLALGMVLIFTVTRVIYVPFGDIAVFTALSLASLESGHTPGTIKLVAALAVIATIMETAGLLHAGRGRAIPRAMGLYLVLPLAIAGVVWAATSPVVMGWAAAGGLLPGVMAAGATTGNAGAATGAGVLTGMGAGGMGAPFIWPMPVRIGLAILLVLPIAPLLDRIVFRPVADGSVLLLMIIAVSLHFALAGIALMFFGPEGVRTETLTDASLTVGDTLISGQTVMIVAAALLFSLLLFLFFRFTLTGKALRATAVNRVGARLVAIRPNRAGTLAYLIGSLMAAVSGVLIAPVNTVLYDSGFLLGLFAFVGAIIGGLASYPGTAVGAVLVGLLGSFASFYSSSFKEVIVFAVLIPVLLWRSLATLHTEEEIEE